MKGLSPAFSDSPKLGVEKTPVLLVDDSPDGLLAMEAVLKTPEYDLLKASSGRDAISHLLNHDVAVILLDVQMPEVDGFQTAKLIKRNELFKHIPIIFVTAISKEKQHIDEGYLSGAVDYIFKPFEPHILRSKVAVFVDLFKKNRTIKEQTRLLLQSERRDRERHLAELELENLRRYRTLADAIPHIVWKVRSDGTADYFNRFWFEYTGCTLEYSYQEGWQAALHPEDCITLLRQWEEARRTKAEVQAECRIIRRRDGKYRWHMARIMPEIKGGAVTGWIGTCTDIHERKEAQEELELKVQERTTELSVVNEALTGEIEEKVKAQKEILAISEREQRRIGQDLHDGLAQELVAVSFMSQIMHQKLQEKNIPEAEDSLRIVSLLKKAVEETRNISRGFYPIELEKNGLAAALQEFVINTAKIFDFPIHYYHDEKADVKDKAAAYHLYRITQEAAHNIIKHSRARYASVELKLEHSGGLFLVIKDDGIGFSSAKKSQDGMGLRTMYYRAKMIGADLDLKSAPGKGTLIECWLAKGRCQ